MGVVGTLTKGATLWNVGQQHRHPSCPHTYRMLCVFVCVGDGVLGCGAQPHAVVLHHARRTLRVSVHLRECCALWACFDPAAANTVPLGGSLPCLTYPCSFRGRLLLGGVSRKGQGVSHSLGLGLFLLTVIQCCASITLWGRCGTCTCTAVALSGHHGMACQGFVLSRGGHCLLLSPGGGAS